MAAVSAAKGRVIARLFVVAVLLLAPTARGRAAREHVYSSGGGKDLDVQDPVKSSRTQIALGQHFDTSRPGDSLYLSFQNNMDIRESSGFSVDCVAYLDPRPAVDDLGGKDDPPVRPKSSVTFYVNLLVIKPYQLSCTLYWSERQKTLIAYNKKNLQLQSLNGIWGVDEKGFSLYNTMTQHFDLYTTW